MSNISEKLSLITDAEQKLLQQKKSLIDKRKQEIGALVEKYNLLTLADEVWIGLFLELKTVIQNNTSRIKELENSGARFRHSRKRNNKKVKQDHNFSSTASPEIQTYENT